MCSSWRWFGRVDGKMMREEMRVNETMIVMITEEKMCWWKQSCNPIVSYDGASTKTCSDENVEKQKRTKGENTGWNGIALNASNCSLGLWLKSRQNVTVHHSFCSFHSQVIIILLSHTVSHITCLCQFIVELPLKLNHPINNIKRGKKRNEIVQRSPDAQDL